MGGVDTKKAAHTTNEADTGGIEGIFEAWLTRFGEALERQDTAEVVGFFAEDGFWKDILSFTWGYRTFGGKDDISAALEATLSQTRPSRLRPAANRTKPRVVRRSARSVIEAYFDFDTPIGQGTGFVRLLHDADRPDDPAVWILLTTLQQLHGFEERIGDLRPTGEQYSRSFAGDNWLDERRRSASCVDGAPDVLIVGAGQGGLALAARLGQVGVRTLVVEKNGRIGDNWRNRYHSLTLHNEVWANNLPYLPFPSTWPTFVPKDKLAGWLEGYAEFMELDVWTSTEFVEADYDTTAKRWTARVRGQDGTIQELRPTHLVLASGGTSGIPHRPDLPGLDDFRGTVMHSSEFTSGLDFTGRKALVIGTGNSGHDVAQDLYSNGADVTIMQRKPTCVVSLVPSGTMVYSVYSEGPPADDVDLVTAAIPFPVLQNTYQWLTKRTCALDKELLDGLRERGFQLEFGPDDTGFHMLYLRRGGGYYINVGCSDMIISGEIKLIHSQDYNRFVESGLRMGNDEVYDFDLVVMATGYSNQQEGIRRMLGDEIADKIGPVWGFDENYIMRNMWQRTAQENLWLMGGSLLDCRLYSRFLALLIKAELEGIAQTEVGLPSTRYDADGTPRAALTS
ncbi:flavin-containing monooxygenase [Streptomyces sp. NPDC004629]|uniref:flavin-containing monooxygenase n=1 Tax=Streptomyces sp. NPDC004629 TaxID=3364705 RepID=UPI00367A9026